MGVPTDVMITQDRHLLDSLIIRRETLKTISFSHLTPCSQVRNRMFDTTHFRAALSIALLVLIQSIAAHKTLSIKNVGAFCANDTSHGQPNLIPIDDSPARFVGKVENGTLYQIGAGEDQIWLIHVYGHSGYDYGYAYGTLLREQINKVLPRAWAHFEQQIIESIEFLKLPKWFMDLVADKGLAFALDFQNALVERYIDKEIYAEMRGISDAAQIDYATVRRLHMLGEITRGREESLTRKSN